MIRPASALQNGGLYPILTFSPVFPMIFTMKTMFQVGLNGQVSVPPEKRFLIHNCAGGTMSRSTPETMSPPANGSLAAKKCERELGKTGITTHED